MQVSKPDNRIFASYPMPAKIDLLEERPRRESLIERQLEDQISLPRITVNEQVVTTINNTDSFGGHQQQEGNWNGARANGVNNYHQSLGESSSLRPTGRSEVKETRIVINRHSSPVSSSPTNNYRKCEEQVVNNTNFMIQQQQHQQQPQQQQQQQHHRNYNENQQQPIGPNSAGHIEQSTTTLTTSVNKVIQTNELAEKEAKLMREIEALHQRPYNSYQSAGIIDLRGEQTNAAQQQYQIDSPRPHSSASSTGADLLEKEAKLLKEIEEIESKPFNPQTMVVEREKWYEYPKNRPDDRHLTDSKRRIRDFCSTPPGLLQDRHIHEENLPIKNQPSPTPSSIYTTIIRSPKREIDNKSPLPFAFDNFTTKGVRGNIATVGAVEPDRPRPPIFPIVKRSPSPAFAHN